MFNHFFIEKKKRIHKSQVHCPNSGLVAGYNKIQYIQYSENILQNTIQNIDTYKHAETHTSACRYIYLQHINIHKGTYYISNSYKMTQTKYKLITCY